MSLINEFLDNKKSALQTLGRGAFFVGALAGGVGLALFVADLHAKHITHVLKNNSQTRTVPYPVFGK